MDPLTGVQIRRSLANCSRSEAAAMTLPRDFSTIDWDRQEFLGLRDPKAPLRGYLVLRRHGAPVGLVLRAADSAMSRKVTTVCHLCRSTRPGSDMSLFAARRGGPAGRNGNTVGTYICADLACSRNVRVEKATPDLHPDVGRTVAERIAGLQSRLDAFVAEVLDGARLNAAAGE